MCNLLHILTGERGVNHGKAPAHRERIGHLAEPLDYLVQRVSHGESREKLLYRYYCCRCGSAGAGGRSTAETRSVPRFFPFALFVTIVSYIASKCWTKIGSLSNMVNL